jgi:guanylate kinase
MAKQTKQGRIIILSGPSGAGKTTLHDLLLKHPRFSRRIVRSISATTRAPRGQERHGREYLFLSQPVFTSRIKREHFLEWAKVFDNYYGTPRKNVQEVLKTGKSVLLCIDVQGGRLVKDKDPSAISIFVKTPSLEELKRRLKARGTDSKESMALRLKTAREELRQACYYDHVVINDSLDHAQQALEDILVSYGI